MSSDKGLFAEIRYHWIHARPHTRKIVPRFAIGFSCAFAITTVAGWLHFHHWLTVLLCLIPLIYMACAYLIFLAGEITWEMQENNRKLEEQLTSPDLNQRFVALRVRLRGRDARELEKLQKVMEFGANEAERLAGEIKKYEGITTAMRDQQNRDRQSAEALAKLLDSEVERVAEIIERKGRLNQWVLLVLGAILGVAVQALAQWIF